MKQLIFQFFVQFKLQLVAYLFSFRPAYNPKKFVVFCQGRTGSTLLVDLLNSHPDLHCEDEIFNRQRHLLEKKVIWPYRFLKGMSAQQKEKTFGFKVKIYQLTKHQGIVPNDFLDHLEKLDYKIIYLRRNNFLEHALSGLTAKQTKQYHLFKGDADQTQQMEFSAALLEQKMRARAAFQKEELTLLKGRNYFEVVYEQNLKHPNQHQIICDRIFAYLELDKTQVSTQLKKVIRKNPSEKLSNFASLKDHFKDTKFAVFFNKWDIKTETALPSKRPNVD